jgi:glyoxylase-like metal-dependent hydrolase (beta-lactamase superfamily II)
VLAHRADAPFIRAAAAGPAPDLADWEQPIYERVMSQFPGQPVIPPRIDRELADGDELGFGDGAVAIAVPGHTPGSVALHLPRHQVLITGDAVARRQDGTVMCGDSTSTAPRRPRRFAGSQPWTSPSHVSGTASRCRSPTTPRLSCGQPQSG